MAERTLLDMNRRQWGVLFAAWLGWGFDVFDALLFNYVATNCIVTLLALTPGTPEAKSAVLFWTGVASSVLLVGAAIGGIAFGRVADRLGRSRTMLITMGLYALATAACALAPNLAALVVLRFVAALGIGGEWAAGAAMVAEVVPEKRRVEAGALLYTAAPIGLFLATGVNWLVAGVLLSGDPSTSWRWIFACGVLPAVVALGMRVFLREPERWEAAREAPARFAELFAPGVRRQTVAGLSMALTGMLMWWGCNAFIPLIAGALGAQQGTAAGLAGPALQAAIEGSKTTATNLFNLGGLIGTLVTVPIAQRLGRRPMYAFYFLASALSIYATFGLDWPGDTRLWLYFPVGLFVFGVFGSFTYYLPELFPTRLRASGAGFCYNAGRIVAAAGPFVVGAIAARGTDAFASALEVMSWVAIVPLLGLFALPLAVETRGKALAD
jgi:MFS family permease